MLTYRGSTLTPDTANDRQHWRVVEIAGEDAKRAIAWLKADPSFRDPRLQSQPRFAIYRAPGHRSYQIVMTTKVFARLRREVKIAKMYW